jgi:hypothetical protein
MSIFIRACPQVFAMNGSVAALLVSLLPESVSRNVDAAHNASSAPVEGDGGGARDISGNGGEGLLPPPPPPPCFNSHPHLTLWIAQKGFAYLANALLARLVSPEVGFRDLGACLGFRVSGLADETHISRTTMLHVSLEVWFRV